jgi:hypothetical protein
LQYKDQELPAIATPLTPPVTAGADD